MPPRAGWQRSSRGSRGSKRCCQAEPQPQSPGEDAAAPRGRCPSPPHTCGSGLWDGRRGRSSCAAPRPDQRRSLAAPAALRAGPVAPRLHPLARPRTQRPPLAQPGSPTASTGGSPTSSPIPDGAPPGMLARLRAARGGWRGGHGDTRTQTRLWRSCARPPSPGPAARGPGRFSSAAARPSRPHALRAALTHRGRTERVPARTERGGRRRAQTPQRLPRPPPASLPLIDCRR